MCIIFIISFISDLIKYFLKKMWKNSKCFLKKYNFVLLVFQVKIYPQLLRKQNLQIIC